jgi:hypothetical protein
VYVIRSAKGFDVTLSGGHYWSFKSEQDVLSLLVLLREAGYKIPVRATERLAKEILKEK